MRSITLIKQKHQAKVTTTMIEHLTIIQGNILTFTGDAIVNPANIALKGGGGLCGQIFEAAGNGQACDAISYCPFGDAVVTPGFNLPARYIIHTPTPIYGDHYGQEADILKSCYWESLRRAEELDAVTIAFPLLATGIHRYPKQAAAQLAFEAIAEYYEDNPSSPIHISFYAYTEEDEAVCKEALTIVVAKKGNSKEWCKRPLK